MIVCVPVPSVSLLPVCIIQVYLANVTTHMHHQVYTHFILMKHCERYSIIDTTFRRLLITYHCFITFYSIVSLALSTLAFCFIIIVPHSLSRFMSFVSLFFFFFYFLVSVRHWSMNHLPLPATSLTSSFWTHVLILDAQNIFLLTLFLSCLSSLELTNHFYYCVSPCDLWNQFKWSFHAHLQLQSLFLR